MTAACTLLKNNQIWICCWWLAPTAVLAGCDFKIAFMVLALLPCILRGNWITTVKVTRFFSSFLLYYPLFYPFNIGDKLLLIFLHTSRTRFRSYLIKLLYKDLHLLLPANHLYQEFTSIPSCALLYKPVEVFPFAAHSFSPHQKTLVKIHLFYLEEIKQTSPT